MSSQGLGQHVEGFSLKKRVIPISYYMIQVLIYWAQSTINNKVRHNRSAHVSTQVPANQN